TTLPRLNYRLLRKHIDTRSSTNTQLHFREPNSDITMVTSDPLDRQYKVLSREQIDHFMRHGFVRIPEAFPKSKAEEWTATVWKRLGYDPNDKSTWYSERTNMPAHRHENVRTFSPKAFAAMCDLLGEDRIDPESAMWGDSF